MTLCAVGLWYWYRVPFEVVHDWALSGEQLRRRDTYHEVETLRRTWDGTARHGPRRISVNGKLCQVENYRDGIPHGKWEWFDSAGRVTISAEFRLGRLESFQASPECDQRLARLLADGTIRERRFARTLLQDAQAQFIETPLKDALHILADDHDMHIRLDAMLKSPEFSIDMPVTCQAQGPLIQVLGQVLQPHDLVCDYRFGMLYVVKKEGVENWKDPTGVTELVPPTRSRLERMRKEKHRAAMEFIETPLADALHIIADAHNIKFDTSQMPAELIQPDSPRAIVVTTNLSGITFDQGLGAMFDVLDLQARLDGETIVIELQPDHPAAQKRQR